MTCILGAQGYSEAKSDVSVELSGGLPQQLDSLITNSAWMGDTERLMDFYLCTLR